MRKLVFILNLSLFYASCGISNEIKNNNFNSIYTKQFSVKGHINKKRDINNSKSYKTNLKNASKNVIEKLKSDFISKCIEYINIMNMQGKLLYKKQPHSFISYLYYKFKAPEPFLKCNDCNKKFYFSKNDDLSKNYFFSLLRNFNNKDKFYCTGCSFNNIVSEFLNSINNIDHNFNTVLLSKYASYNIKEHIINEFLKFVLQKYSLLKKIDIDDEKHFLLIPDEKSKKSDQLQNSYHKFKCDTCEWSLKVHKDKIDYVKSKYSELFSIDTLFGNSDNLITLAPYSKQTKKFYVNSTTCLGCLLYKKIKNFITSLEQNNLIQ